MVAITDLIKRISASLTELQSSEVLKERVLLLKDQLDVLKERVIDLEKENARLKEEHDETQVKLQSLSVPDEFVEHQGALFKKKPGGYHLAVYCPRCHTSTFSLENALPFSCESCKWAANFTGGELESIMKDLPD